MNGHQSSIDEVVRFLSRPAGPQLKGEISFETIQINKHKDLCIKFRKDSYFCSFGSTEKYLSEGGDHSYLKWLDDKITQNPGAAVHMKWNGKIIGQVELGKMRSLPHFGYVNLFYLAPEFRGKGFSVQMDQYATQFLWNCGHQKARLSVSPTNERAVKYYLKMGWKDIGPRPNHEEVHLMEKSL
jgi:ribosomal protein S18 acetylase RimI-like enzyme